MIDELREPEVLETLAKLKARGLSWKGITDKISDELGKEISVKAVRNAYDLVATKNAELMTEDEELKGKLTKIVFNQKDQIEKINKTCNSLLDELMESKEDPMAAISAMKEIREQIKLQKELLERLTDGFDPNKINRIEYTNISVNNLNELEKQGYIKILRKPGQPYDPEYKDLVSISKEQLEELNKKGAVNLKDYCIQLEE